MTSTEVFKPLISGNCQSKQEESDFPCRWFREMGRTLTKTNTSDSLNCVLAKDSRGMRVVVVWLVI